jgi:uncharacterized protein DUF1264
MMVSTAITTTAVVMIAAISGVIFAAISSTTTTTVMAQQDTNATTAARPTEGYDAHVVGIRSIYGLPEMEAHFYCKMNENIMATCQIYDSSSANANLIGIEYIISAEQFNSLPEEEKPNWYILNETLAQRSNLRIPELSQEESNEALSGFLGTYGKLILTWNPQNPLPSSPPQLVDLHNRELVNPSAAGSNATTTDAADTNAATTAGPPEEEGGGGGEEQRQQPQQQTTPTLPAPNPLFE